MDNIAKITPRNTDILKDKMFTGGEPQLPPITLPQIDKIGETGEKKEPEVLKVALIGTAPSSRLLAPFHDPSWKIWACSPGNMHGLPRVDTWFEIHSNLLWPENRHYGEPYVNWLKAQTFPIYMQDSQLVPNATPLPIGELVQEFGKYFFTSSFAYMMAMAMKAGAKEIALYGVDMASKDEYVLQRAGGQYFMQLAASRGIKVQLPMESDLAQHPPLYGYSDSTPFGRKISVRKKELDERISQMKTDRDKLVHALTYLEGAREDLDYVESIWGGIQT